MSTQPSPRASVNGGGGLERASSGIIMHTKGYCGLQDMPRVITFLGHLWKSVEVAAKGTVPVPPIAREGEQTGGREERCLMDRRLMDKAVGEDKA